jgi:GPI-anchor transamidase subunit S
MILFVASSASNDPVLHFILFIPSASRRPLYITTEGSKLTDFALWLRSHPFYVGSPSNANAFLLPQWGGIVILNLPERETSTFIELSLASLDPIFSVFSGQLLALLGVPPLPLVVKRAPQEGAHVLSNWQLDALLRQRALENTQGSQETLLSIIKLVDQIKNMPVGQDVKGDIQNALTALEEVRLWQLTKGDIALMPV